MNTRRPLPLIVAIVLLILLSVFGLISLFSPSPPPLFIQLFTFIVDGVGGLIALVGLWTLKRWGWRLSSIIAVLTMLVAGSGLWWGRGTGGRKCSQESSSS